MEIKRDEYLDKLIKREKNTLVKVITGIRRCGKSYLLFKLYRDYLIAKGIKEDHIVQIALDDLKNESLRDKHALYDYIKALIKDSDTYYVCLDEIQFVKDFSDLVNGLNHIDNVDLYVTGSNSKFLSSDILTELRGRSDEIRVYPLNFSEYCSAYDGSISQAWKEYYTYGGLPLILRMDDDTTRAEYLDSLFRKVYFSDILEHNRVQNESEVEELVDILASSIGSLTNPSKLAKTFQTVKHSRITDKTISRYISFFEDAFLLEKAKRYDVKGKAYIETPQKYYFTDVGLRNARLGFRQQEENHIMENIIYNELRVRGYRVDVGIVDFTETLPGGLRKHKQLEVDFIANRGGQKYYIQSAFEMSSQEKLKQERRPLLGIGDSFKKIIVVKDDIKLKRDDDGIITMGIWDFLLKKDSLQL
jgi:predicted AAA+ superfamily ATPase